MKNQQNIIQTKRLFEEVFNKENLHACNDIISIDVILHDPARIEEKYGLDAFKEVERSYIKAFPNKHVKIDEIFCADDKVIVRWTCHGIHKGVLEDIPATNRDFRVSGISIYRFSNGKINEIWQSWDRFGLFEQLGVMPSAHTLI